MSRTSKRTRRDSVLTYALVLILVVLIAITILVVLSALDRRDVLLADQDKTLTVVAETTVANVNNTATSEYFTSTAIAVSRLQQQSFEAATATANRIALDFEAEIAAITQTSQYFSLEATRLASIPTSTFTATATQTPSATNSPTLTSTPTYTQTPTFTPTNTATATETPTSTPTNTATATPDPYCTLDLRLSTSLYEMPIEGSARIIENLPSGRSVDVLANLRNPLWSYIRVGNDQYGWVPTNVLGQTPSCSLPDRSLAELYSRSRNLTILPVVIDETFTALSLNWRAISPTGASIDLGFSSTSDQVLRLPSQAEQLVVEYVSNEDINNNLAFTVGFDRANIDFSAYVGIRIPVSGNDSSDFYEVRVQANCAVQLVQPTGSPLNVPYPGSETDICRDTIPDYLEVRIVDQRLTVNVNGTDVIQGRTFTAPLSGTPDLIAQQARVNIYFVTALGN